MVGGDLHWIWAPYALYQEVDYVRVTLHPRVRTLTISFWVVGERYTASRHFKKTMDSPMPNASSRYFRDGYPTYQLDYHRCLDAAFMNLIETALNLCYLYLAHVVKYPAASVVGFASVTMTLSKTMLYWIQEYYCNYCAIGHNDTKTLIIYWIIPNG
jgi:hypothetical protein